MIQYMSTIRIDGIAYASDFMVNVFKNKSDNIHTGYMDHHHLNSSMFILSCQLFVWK